MSKKLPASVVVFLAAGFAQAYPPHFTSQNVTPPAGWVGNMLVRGMNDSGQVVGTVQDGGGYVRGFVWLPSPAYGLPAGPTLLPNAGNLESSAVGINNAGRVCGSVAASGDVTIWDLSVGMAPVLVRANAHAHCISSTGAVGGTGAPLSGCDVAGVFVVGSNSPVANTECTNSFVSAINSSGLAVGDRYTGGQFGFFALPPLYVGRPVVNYPGALPSHYVNIRDVDDTGRMVGQIIHPVQGQAAFMFKDLNGDGVADPATEYTILSTPEAGGCGAVAINNFGEVVGTQSSTGRAILWRGGREIVLNNYVSNRTGPLAPYVKGAVDINNAGQILCQAYTNGTADERAVVLTSQCYANCDGSVIPPKVNVMDFGCFLNKFASGDTYANCDESTTPPVLNIADFACFMNAAQVFCP